MTHQKIPESLQRIAIIGSSGSGKSTLAIKLHKLLDYPCIEMDELCWKDDWQSRSTEELRNLVEQATQQNTWVLAGNYGSCRDIVWPRATTIIWLNLPFIVVMKQLLIRTFRRWWTAEELFNTNNVETLDRTFSKDSILWWAIKTWQRRQREYPQAFALPEHQHLSIIEFNTHAQVDTWLHQFKTLKKP